MTPMIPVLAIGDMLPPLSSLPALIPLIPFFALGLVALALLYTVRHI